MRGRLIKTRKKLGITFIDKILLKEALTPNFYFEKEERPLYNNKRLGALGDAVLDLAVREHLYKNFSRDHDRENLFNRHDNLVSNQKLSEIANEIGLYDFLCLPKRIRDITNYKLASALEAIIGAIFVDQGYETARSFISRVYSRHFQKVEYY